VDLGDSQISNVAPVILPDMYRIFMEKEQYSVRTRSRAIEIFNTLGKFFYRLFFFRTSNSCNQLSQNMTKNCFGRDLPE
jgi:hypothetical protein